MTSQLVLLPGAPVLVPELSRGAWVEVSELVDVGVRLLSAAVAAGEPVTVIVAGDDEAEIPARTHDLRRWGAPRVTVGPRLVPTLDANEADGVPGAALMAWWWLRIANVTSPVTTHVVPGLEGDPAAAPGRSGRAGGADRVARLLEGAPGSGHTGGTGGVVLVIADGPAALAPKAPIPERASAVELDEALTSWIDTGAPFPRRTSAEARADGWWSAPLWHSVASSVAGVRAGDAAHAAPFGVGYHVASWDLSARDTSPTGGSGAALRPAGRPSDPGRPAHPGRDRRASPIVVVGPTGTGKSELALDLAERLDGHIVNLDAMQLYHGMDIGTAKVPADSRRGIPHHLFDVLEVTETASVAEYQSEARRVVEEIMDGGHVPVVVGGSMLYYQSLLDEWEFPDTDPEVRARYERRLAEIGVEALHAELAAVDPEAAGTILPTDPRRTVRALEVVELTGKPFSASRPRIGRQRWGARILGLDVATEELDPRLEARTDAMFDGGLVDEVRRLVRRGLREGVTARRAIGYAQVLDALDASREGDPEEAALEEARFRTFVGTRRYVRRQRSWFRRDPRITWLDAGSDARLDLPSRALAALGEEPRGETT